MNDKLSQDKTPTITVEEEYNRRFGQTFAELTRGSEYGNLYDLSRRGMPNFNPEGLGSFDYGQNVDSSVLGALDGEMQHPLMQPVFARPSEQQVNSSLTDFSGRERISPELDVSYHDAAQAFYAVKILGVDLSVTSPQLHELIHSGQLEELLNAGQPGEARVRNLRFETELKRIQGSAMLKASQLDLALSHGANFQVITDEIGGLFEKSSWDALSENQRKKLEPLKSVFERRESLGMGAVLEELNALKNAEFSTEKLERIFDKVEVERKSAFIQTEVLFPALNSIENRTESLIIQALYAKSSSEPRSLVQELEAQLKLHMLTELGESSHRSLKLLDHQVTDMVTQLREGFDPARAALQYARILDVIENDVGRDGQAIGWGEGVGGAIGLLVAYNSLRGAERNFFATDGVAQPSRNPLKWKPGVLLGAAGLTVLGMGIGREIEARQVPIEAWGELERLTYGLTPEQQQQIRNQYDKMSKPRTEQNGGEAIAIKEIQNHLASHGSDFKESLKGLLPPEDLKALEEGRLSKEISSRMIRALAHAPGLREVFSDVDTLVADGTLDDEEIVALAAPVKDSPALQPFVELMVLAEAAQRASSIHTDYSAKGIKKLLEVDKRASDSTLPQSGTHQHPGADQIVEFLHEKLSRVPTAELPQDKLHQENHHYIAQFLNFVSSETTIEGGSRSAREYILQQLEKRIAESAKLAGTESVAVDTWLGTNTGLEEHTVKGMLAAKFNAKEVATTFWGVVSSMELPLEKGKVNLERAFMEDQAIRDVSRGLFGDPDAPYNPEEKNPFARMSLSKGQVQQVIDAIGEVTGRTRNFDQDMTRNLRHYGTGNSDIPETVFGNIQQQFVDPQGWHDQFFRDRGNNKLIYAGDPTVLIGRAAPNVHFRVPTDAELTMATNPAKREFLERTGIAAQVIGNLSSQLLHMLEAEREKKFKQLYPHMGG